MAKIPISQRTDAWHDLKANKISSTMASVLMGVNPFKSKIKLWEELVGLRAVEPPNQKMLDGIALESEALSMFESLINVKMEPAVIVSDRLPWQMTSLDGMSEDGKIIVEIKVGDKAYRNALAKNLEPYYYAQCQHHLSVTALDKIYYFCYWKGKLVQTEIMRNQEYIDRMEKVEEQFYFDWQNMRPPVEDIELPHEIPESEWNKRLEQTREQAIKDYKGNYL